MFVCCTNGINKIKAISFSNIIDGVSYKTINQETQNPLSIHIIKVDPKKTNIKIAHALGEGLNREKVSSIASRLNVICAVNGGHYRRGWELNGNSLGLLQINGKIYTDPQFYRGGIGLKGNEILIDRIKVLWKLTINNKDYHVDRVNQPLGISEGIIYTLAFRKSTLAQNCTEIVCQDNKVIAINKHGNSDIPLNGFVYTISNESNIDLSEITVGDEMSLKYQTEPSVFKSLQDIVCGGPILIKNDTILSEKYFKEELSCGEKIVLTNDEITADFHRGNALEWFVERQHPRTAIGKTKDGFIILVVVDGRNKDKSVGVSLSGLANIMKDLGCIDAVNLGGGGDTTMYLNGKVINDTSGGENQNKNLERPVSDAIIVLPKETK